ncbi:hypothetical protein ZWY2020_057368 [Hordeum vulgare]|nr:hypothetical protein ZWY2020_057368 [Hordeum vulgare]
MAGPTFGEREASGRRRDGWAEHGEARQDPTCDLSFFAPVSPRLAVPNLFLGRRQDLVASSRSGGAAQLYEGRVRHSRRRPTGHAFEYAVRYALIDLDLLPLPGHLSAADTRVIASTPAPCKVALLMHFSTLSRVS